VDTPRTVPGAADGILRTLEHFGFEWDGPVVWQSRRTDAYRAAFEQLRAAGQVFACACTRKEIADSALARDGTRRYPGTCRNGLPPGREARAWRLRVEPGVVSFDDAVQGLICEDVAADVGDFVLLRADGLFAYQLAVVVDDAEAASPRSCGGRPARLHRPADIAAAPAWPSLAGLRPPAGGQQQRR
jgi:glutamyl-Q tRNA(Asp) synthetase